MSTVTFVVGPAQRLAFRTRSGHYYSADETKNPPEIVVETDEHSGAVDELTAAGYKQKADETAPFPQPVIYEVTPVEPSA
jgi:hypothetical protein